MAAHEHPGTIKLLNYSSGLPLEEEVREHIVGCAECQRAVNLLREEEGREQENLQPAQTLAAMRERAAAGAHTRRLGPLRWVSAGAAALVLIALALVAFLGTGGPDAPEGIRTKGDLAVQVYLNRDGRTVEVHAGAKFRRGDRIRLGVLSARPASVSVSAKDGGRFVPIPDLAGISLIAGEEVVLPGSLTLGCDGPIEELELEVSYSRAPKISQRRTLVLGCQAP